MKRILIVDDDIAIARAMALRLQTRGYLVASARDLASARERLRNEGADLILLDIHLPGADGFGFAKALREEKGAGEERTDREAIGAGRAGPIPIVFMTASSDPKARVRAEAMNAAGFLEKPYRPEELLAVVGKALETRNQELAVAGAGRTAEERGPSATGKTLPWFPERKE